MGSEVRQTILDRLAQIEADRERHVVVRFACGTPWRIEKSRYDEMKRRARNFRRSALSTTTKGEGDE